MKYDKTHCQFCTRKQYRIADESVYPSDDLAKTRRLCLVDVLKKHGVILVDRSVLNSEGNCPVFKPTFGFRLWKWIKNI